MAEKRYSEILKQNIAIDKDKKLIYVEDGTVYTSKELQILKEASNDLKFNLHKIKKMFGGTFVRVPPKFFVVKKKR